MSDGLIKEIKVSGLKELDQELARFYSTVQKKAMRDSMRAGAIVIRDGARANAPRRNPGGTGSMFRELVRVSKGSTKFRGPGYLKANISIWIARKFVQAGATFAYHIGARKYAFYGKFLEWGTSKMAARPWLRPAFDSLHKWAIEVTAQTLKHRIKQAWRRGQGNLTYIG